ncbi:hypothetical protein ASD24_23150 [Paenibacillus sp. Root52]|uniref:hypothetical protein n=1 Tax=Paenibacillus sp. Root52 TaxID=1736552 RepID=UPI00070137C2|nr:hypothetical protein [Paenibacillus sp. Root52]KQY91634.1 hypothetical protein ASD24_23150 [Paenibacillus sp. Root52]
MNYVFQFNSSDERDNLIIEHDDKFLIEERNITEGNFLVFSDERPQPPIVYVSVPSEEFENLKQESTLLKAQSNALSDRADFVEDVIAEMAEQVYG